MIRWERIAQIRTMMLVILGMAAIVTGVWFIYMPAGVITLGLASAALAYLTDPTPVQGGNP